MHIELLSVDGRWLPTRAHALRRLATFVPHAGRAYAAQRNYDRGPSDRANISTLSPYIRHRIVSEPEVLAAVLERHSPAAAEKFVQEVFWRTYWKGWLEAHPDAWSRYRSALDERLADLQRTPDWANAYAAAIGGRTGIDAFDAWARELVAFNYLHNHARMWFASIWIFTLKLPWELGADFFMQHLLDGDPASNTLSWRWVAGLHTRGRTYMATRANIQHYTGDRFEVMTGLARSAPALEDGPIQLAAPVVVPAPPRDAAPALFVIHDDDLHGDRQELPAGISGVIAFSAAARRSPQIASAAVQTFSAALAREALAVVATTAAATNLGFIEATEPNAIAAAVAAAARACKVTRIVAAFAPVGPARDVLSALSATAAENSFEYAEAGRRYDTIAWPAATRGFFNLRSRIPTIVAELGIGAG